MYEECTDERSDFLYVDTDSHKLKADQKLFGWAWSKKVWPVWLCNCKIDLYLKNELMEWSNFLHAGTISGKLKVNSVIFGWAWLKNGHGLLVHETLKSAAS